MSDKMQLLVKRLLEKSKSGELRWVESTLEDGFELSLPQATIRLYLMKEQFLGGEEWLALLVRDEEGRFIESIGSNDLPEEERKRLTELYQIVRRQALKVEETLDQVLEALG